MKATPAGRLLFQLAAKVFRTEGTEFGLLPTPRASENDQGRKADGMRDGLSSRKAQGRGATLTTYVKQMMPTPRCANGMTGKLRDPEKIGNPRGRLEDVISLMMPTPTAQDFKRRGPNSKQQGLSNTENFVEEPRSGDLLNPLFVEEMMGYPTGWTELRD